MSFYACSDCCILLLHSSTSSSTHPVACRCQQCTWFEYACTRIRRSTQVHLPEVYIYTCMHGVHIGMSTVWLMHGSMHKEKCLFIVQHAYQDRSNWQSFVLLQAEVISKTLIIFLAWNLQYICTVCIWHHECQYWYYEYDYTFITCVNSVE